MQVCIYIDNLRQGHSDRLGMSSKTERIPELAHRGVLNREHVFGKSKKLRKLLYGSIEDVTSDTFYLRHAGVEEFHGDMTFPELVRTLYRFAQLEPHFSGNRDIIRQLLVKVQAPDFEPPPAQLLSLERGWAENTLEWIDFDSIWRLSWYLTSLHDEHPDIRRGIYFVQQVANPALPASPDASIYRNRIDFIPPFLAAIMSPVPATARWRRGRREIGARFFRGKTELTKREDAEKYVIELLDWGHNPALEMVSFYTLPDSERVQTTSFFGRQFYEFHQMLFGYAGDDDQWDHFYSVMVRDPVTGYRKWVRAAETNGELRRYYIHLFQRLHRAQGGGLAGFKATKRIVDELVPIWKDMERETGRRAGLMGVREQVGADVAERDPMRTTDRYYLSDVPMPLMSEILRYSADLEPGAGGGSGGGGDDDESAKRSRAEAALKAVLSGHRGDVHAAARFLLGA